MPGSFISGTGVWTEYGMMLQGPGTMIYTNGAVGSGNAMVIQNHHGAYGLGIYDCDTPIVIGSSAILSNESNIYGDGITTCVINIVQGGCVVDNNTYVANRPTCVATGAPSDFIINNQTSLPAMDPVTYALTAPIALTFANMHLTVLAGGFEGRVFDPRSPT